MYNLISFPHYTCGGLLCDILNNTWSEVGTKGEIKSLHHSMGKIGDTNTVLTEYNVTGLIGKIKKLVVADSTWIGTHCSPTEEVLAHVDKVIVISTATHRSQLYRWARAYYHYFSPQWTKLHGTDRIDKMRETAKNYIAPFVPICHHKVTNLEFADVVENTQEFKHAINYIDVKLHITRWQEVNSFLYDTNFWNSDAVKSFYQAEHEVKLGRYYRYN